MTEIHIDLPKIKEIALRAVRRAAAFLGLGMNAALDPTFRNFRLTNLAALEFLPEQIDDSTAAHIKDEFGKWVVGCGLRELTEAFAVFLDEIHHSCLLMSAVAGSLHWDGVQSRDKLFRFKGLGGKL